MPRARTLLRSVENALALAAAVGLLAGCSQALGLEGLTFEEVDDDAGVAPLDAEPDSSTGTGGSAGGATATTGVFIDTQAYPQSLPAGARLVGTPGRAGAAYFLYDPEIGHMQKHSVDVAAERYELGASWDWEPGWSLLSLVPAEDGAVLIGYEAASGLAQHIAVDADGAPLGAPERVAGSPGWTHLVPIETDDAWYSVAYDSESGHYRFGPALVDDAADGEFVVGEWDPGYTALQPVPIGEEVGILKYNATTGRAELEQLTGNADELGATWAADLGEGIDQVVVFATDSGPLVLLYQAELGQVATAWLLLNAGLSFSGHESTPWREDLSQILPLWRGSTPYALTYSASTGVAALRSVLPLEEFPTVVK